MLIFLCKFDLKNVQKCKKLKIKEVEVYEKVFKNQESPKIFKNPKFFANGKKLKRKKFLKNEK